ncbi:MAG: phosphogluconate dehydrogenase (NAD(+)-dependent, decarboxylating) [Acidimicrobiia bacterium]
MELGMIGLGRMGANMVRRLTRAGHRCVVYDLDPDAIAALTRDGAVGASSLADLAAQLDAPRHVWIMVPAAFVEATATDVAAHLEPGDAIVDGGNSYYRDDINRAERFASTGIHYLDVGTSGGVAGFERGYCLMIGGDDEPVRRLEPIFAALAPGVDAAERTAGLDGEPSEAEQGFLHCGPSGAGHFVKMVHNGIEYALMAAYAEGLNILHRANIGGHQRLDDAETSPLRDPQYFRYDFDIAAITELWRRGSVVSSWLLDLTAQAMATSPTLDGYGGRVSDSGEGRWTVLAAIEEGVPAHVLAAALFDRFQSRGEALFANRVLSAMRKEFGGHDERAAE